MQINVSKENNGINGLSFGVSGHENKNSVEGGKKAQGKSIFAGNVSMFQQNEAGDKRAQAQKKAMKRILDQYARDSVKDQMLAESKEKQATLGEEMKAAKGELEKVADRKRSLDEEYGITEDSSYIEDAEKRKEYNKASYGLRGEEKYWTAQVRGAVKGIKGENNQIYSIKTSMLKTHGMVDQVVAAEEIMERASKAIMGDIIGEAKDKMQEDLNKLKEEAEKAAEKEAEEEKTKAAKSKEEKNLDKFSKQMEETSYQIIENVKEYIMKENVVPEDAKGLAVDEEI